MSDLDNEELKATREMKAINKVIAPEEKTADEMFEELGYKKIENKIQITYVKPYENIEFLLNVKKIEYHFLKGSTFLIQTIQELKAINRKCKELGWIE